MLEHIEQYYGVIASAYIFQIAAHHGEAKLLLNKIGKWLADFHSCHFPAPMGCVV